MSGLPIPSRREDMPEFLASSGDAGKSCRCAGAIVGDKTKRRLPMRQTSSARCIMQVGSSATEARAAAIVVALPAIRPQYHPQGGM